MLLTFNIFALISIIVLIFVYYFLITEKIHKVIVSILGAGILIITQVFRGQGTTSQEEAFHFVSKNLDILGFVIGMMILVGIVRESGIFEALSIWLVKKVRGNPIALLIVIGYLGLTMTAFLSNIPAVLILTPVIIVLIRELKLPYFPYLFTLVAMANIGGAATSISDPTTYYQAKTVGLSFFEVLTNSGPIVAILSVTTILYILIVFRKQLKSVHVDASDVALFEPKSAIQNRQILKLGVPILVFAIILMVVKESIATHTGVTLDNATIALGGAFVAMLLFHQEPHKIFRDIVNWEIIFFFIGLFIVVGALEYTQIIQSLGGQLLILTGGNMHALSLIITLGSALISIFIDNVPYNITMVSAIQAMATSGAIVYPLWWGLNLGTSIGGAGSPIAAACNVIVFGQAENEKLHVQFGRYLIFSLPLIIINALITYAIIVFRYL